MKKSNKIEILKEHFEKAIREEIIKRLEEKKWIQAAHMKKGELKSKLGLKDDEDLSMERINSEISKLGAKYKDGQKYSPEDLKTFRELVAARTMEKLHEK